jgi:hypothetical protein
VSPDGNIFATGVTTSTTFVGALTGNVTGNISGGTVAGSTGTFTGDVDIADKIVHTGDTDTAIRFSDADTFSVETAGSQAFRVNSNGEFIMADTSTKTFIDLETTDNNTRALLSVKGKTSGGGDVTLKIGAFGDTQRGEIFTTTNHDLGFATNNAAAQFKMKTDGNLEIVNGDLKVASGHGIDFSATGDGNGTDTSSVFDDYEEGTWTPNFAGSSSNPSFTWISGFPRGYYTKNGQMVTVNFDMAWSGVTAGTGNLQLTGLPYSTIGNFYSGFGIVSHGTGLETASQGPRGIYSNAQVTFLYIVKNASSNVVVSATTLQANGHVFGGFTYRAHE